MYADYPEVQHLISILLCMHIYYLSRGITTTNQYLIMYAYLCRARKIANHCLITCAHCPEGEQN